MENHEKMCGMTDLPIAGLLQDMRDFHAAILNLLGLDQNRLWFLRNGGNEELTDFGGNVIREMPA